PAENGRVNASAPFAFQRYISADSDHRMDQFGLALGSISERAVGGEQTRLQAGRSQKLHGSGPAGPEHAETGRRCCPVDADFALRGRLPDQFASFIHIALPPIDPCWRQTVMKSTCAIELRLNSEFSILPDVAETVTDGHHRKALIEIA